MMSPDTSMVMDLRPRPRHLPKWLYRRWMNRKYPTPHQSTREKERRLVQTARGIRGPENYVNHTAYMIAFERGGMLLQERAAQKRAA